MTQTRPEAALDNAVRSLLAAIVDALTVPHAAEQLRSWTAESPVTYRTWQNRSTQTADEQLHAEGGEDQ